MIIKDVECIIRCKYCIYYTDTDIIHHQNWKCDEGCVQCRSDENDYHKVVNWLCRDHLVGAGVNGAGSTHGAGSWAACLLVTIIHSWSRDQLTATLSSVLPTSIIPATSTTMLISMTDELREKTRKESFQKKWFKEVVWCFSRPDEVCTCLRGSLKVGY